MRRFLQCVLGTVFALAWCAAGQAQSHMRFSAASPAGVRMARSSQFTTTARQVGNRVIVIAPPGLFSFSPFSFGTFPVPGLGFDFVHLAAITRNVKVSDLSVLSTAQRLALLRRLSPVVPFGAAFLPQPAEVVVMQQPPVVVLQQPVTEEAAEPAARTRYVEPKETAGAAPTPQPRDVGEFVLVRRDGRILFAVAFSTEGDQVVYVTREGIRRALPLAELDVETTLRMNEERGTTLHLPV